MTDLTLGDLTLPTAAVGPTNPLPPLFAGGNLDKTADLAAATDEIRAGAAYGRTASVCPYLLQDRYTRDQTSQAHRTAVLENEHLRATFLLDAGGRLWSLIDKPAGEELLFRNPVFQPANLALRNAWFAGGVEWNIGTIGHTPLTCAPLHAVRVRARSTGGHAYDALRMYEFERIRGVVYQIDVHLPPGSPVLYVHVRITNPQRHEVPMYWWSNVAVPQQPDTRVLAPAERAWNYSYDNVLRHDPVAGAVGAGSDDAGTGDDISYPARFFDAADFFFDLGEHPQPWIAAVQGSGTGLFQTSTRQLRGRKLFRWGTSPGGRRWQRWLTGTEDGYAEIQAGLARTQFEHLPMPAGAQWSWTEAYGRIALDAGQAHGAWSQACAAAERLVTATVPADELAKMHTAATAAAEIAPAELLHRGSGWGALERRLRTLAGEHALDLPGTPFPDATLNGEQGPWLDLLHSGTLPELAPDQFPASVVLHPAVVDMLASSSGWTAAALLGVARASGGDLDGAEQALQESLRRADNAYAHRNLATIAARRQEFTASAEHYRHALALAPGSVPLLIEALRALIAAGDPQQALALLDGEHPHRAEGRVRLLEATAALGAGDVGRCGAILSDPGLAVADLREGEDSLDQLWWDYQEARAAAERGFEPDDELRAEIRRTAPLPAHLDFRMHTGER